MKPPKGADITNPPPGFVLADPNNKGWGIMRGKWIREDVMRDMSIIAGAEEDALYELAKAVSNHAGMAVVYGRWTSVMKSMLWEGFVLNHKRAGIGVADQAKGIRQFLQAMKDIEAGKPDQYVREMQVHRDSFGRPLHPMV